MIYFRHIIMILTVSLIAGSSLPAQSIDERKFNLAESYEASGSFDSALQLYEELVRTAPRNAKYFDGIVRIMKSQSKFSELLPLVQKRLKTNKSIQMIALLGELHWKSGNSTEANIAWEETLDSDRQSKSTYSVVAASQISVLQFDKAINTYKQGRSELGKKLFADELSQLYAAVGNYSDGTKEVLIMFAQSKNISLAQGRLSALLTSKQAVNIVGEIISDKAKDNRNNVLYLKLYSWFLHSIKQYDKALEIIIKVDKILKAQMREVYSFANNARKDGNSYIAVKAYGKVIDFGKDKNKYYASSLYGYARTLEEQLREEKNISPKRIAKIIDRYRNMIAAYPKRNTSIEARYRIALIILNKQNDPESAAEELRILINNHSKVKLAAKASILLGSIYVMSDDLDKASELFAGMRKKFTRIAPEEVILADYKIAEIVYFQGHIDSAKVLLGKISIQSTSDAANDALEKVIMIEQNTELVMALSKYAEADLREYQNKLEAAYDLFKETAKISAGDDLCDRSTIRAAELGYKLKKKIETDSMLINYLEEYPESIYADQALILIADSFAAAKNYTEAVKFYTEIILKYPGSMYIQKARKKIREIRQNSNS
ncbi:MAG: tetratricopeptide repeat protein [Chlorobi bacterium]|nr:tetratricopeptide repeat protein [Chlorobiota bacterium]